MIGCFPKLYSDELVYSYLARVKVYNGYMTYRQASVDIFGKVLINPSMEFMDKMLPEVRKHLGKDMQSIILEHTMFPYYGEFLDEGRKSEAFAALWKGTGNYYNLLPVPKNDKVRYLKYCPLCVEDDRKESGETYWHRKHQLSGINVCAKHGCILCDSKVQITGKKTPELITAEMLDSEKPLFGNEIEVKVAQYAEAVLKNADAKSGGNIAAFLNERLTGTAYLSKRGGARKLADLSRDFLEYYKDIRNLPSQDIYRSRLEKILNGKRFDFLEICQLAMFLGISADELAKLEISTKTGRRDQMQEFDIHVVELLKNGTAINEVARQLSISSKTVRDIRDKKFSTGKISERGKGGKRKKD